MVFVLCGQSFGFADPGKGFAAAFVTPELCADAALLQSAFLECLAFTLVTRQRPAVLHAAGVVWKERGLLLTGGIGTGKSTLAYACLRAGFRLIAEDVVYVETQPEGVTAWGNPWYIHLLPDTRRFFPELEVHRAVSLFDGRAKARLDVCARFPNAPATHGAIHAIVSLGRAEGTESALLPADAAVLRHALTHFPDDPPLDHVAQEGAVDRLLVRRSAHLRVGSDLMGAVTLLQGWLDDVEI